MLAKFKEWLHTLQANNRVNTPVIITIHGYGRRCMHEFDNLCLWGKADGFCVVQFNMYDLFDENDHDWKQWVQRAKDCVLAYQKQNRPIYLVGFSMGGVIAAHLASICAVEKLVLLAPAFQYINVDTITDVIRKSASNLLSSDKRDEIPMPRLFYQAFSELIKALKNDIGNVHCPVLLLHGDRDEVISPKSSLYAYNKIPHDKKKLIFLHNGHHRLLMDEAVHWECYQIMKLFFSNVILHDHLIEQADDILAQLQQDYHAHRSTH